MYVCVFNDGEKRWKVEKIRGKLRKDLVAIRIEVFEDLSHFGGWIKIFKYGLELVVA